MPSRSIPVEWAHIRNIVDVPVTTAEWGMTESHNFLSADGHSQQHPLPANRSDHQSNSPQLTTRASVRVVPWQVSDLKPHPTYVQLGIKIPASRLNELIELGEDAFIFPLFVTSTGIVIDGYARLEVALSEDIAQHAGFREEAPSCNYTNR